MGLQNFIGICIFERCVGVGVKKILCLFDGMKFTGIIKAVGLWVILLCLLEGEVQKFIRSSK